MSKGDAKGLALEMLALSAKAIRQAQTLAEARGDRAEAEMLGRRLEAVDWLNEMAVRADEEA